MIHPYWLMILSAIFAGIPVILALATSYMKVSIVLGMLRSGLGTQQVPSGTVIMAFSLALTAIIMAPVMKESIEIMQGQTALRIERVPSLDQLKKYKELLAPWEKFMEDQAGEREKIFFAGILTQLKGAKETHSGKEDKLSAEASQLSILSILPAFMFSELKEAFAMAFVVMLPFLVIDLIVANVLVGLGMYMVSPVMIALPLKLLLFVVSDAWMLLARGLIESYRTF